MRKTPDDIADIDAIEIIDNSGVLDNLNHSSKTPFNYWLFVLPLFVLYFFIHLDHLVLVPLGANISKATGLSLVNTGGLVTIYPMAASVSAFIFAPLSDVCGRKILLLTSCILFALSSLAFAYSDNPTSLFTFRILSGLSAGPMLVNLMAFAGDSLPVNLRSKGFTFILLAFPLASILGVPIGASLADQFHWSLPFLILGIGSLLMSVAIYFMKDVSTGLKEVSTKKLYLNFLALWKPKNLRYVFYIQFFMTVGLFGFVPHISVWLNLNYSMSATEIGLCYMQGGIGAFIGNRVAAYVLKHSELKLTNNHNHNRAIFHLISFGCLIMGVCMIIAVMEIHSKLFTGLLFAGMMLGGSIRVPSIQILLTQIVPIQMRGRMMSMNMIVRFLAMGFGGLWSLPLLMVIDNQLTGMINVGLIGGLSLFLVPLLLARVKIKKAVN